MRSWLAGSITLGTALIALGISTLASKITDAFTLLDIVFWWPVLIIILGFEVLAAVFLSRKNPLNVRYSGGSIFLIALIICFSMFISALGLAADLVAGKSAGGETEKFKILFNTELPRVNITPDVDRIEILIEKVK